MESIDTAETESYESVENESRGLALQLDQITGKVGALKFKKSNNDLIKVETDF